MRTLTALALTLCFACAAYAQPAAQRSRAEEELGRASERGSGVPVYTVFSNVTAQAVMIPADDARRIFGKEIGDRYAVVEVNIGNKSPDAALILHNIFIDYSRWPLSGTRPLPRGVASRADVPQGRFGAFQSSNRENHIASEEYRVVRGQFLNARTWSGRNKILRILEFVGNGLGAYTFSINELGYNKGIAAFGSIIVPGLRTAWPDTSQDQLNLINDLGFQANKVIPKQASEVIVCFFPIYRFLTPGFADLYRKSPALFFAPLQMLVDQKLNKDVDKVLGKDLGLTPEDVRAVGKETVRDALRRQLPCYMRIMNHAQETESGTAPDDSTPLGQINQSERKVCLGMFGLREVDEVRIKPDRSGKETVKVIKFVSETEEGMKMFAPFMVLDFFAQVSLNTVGVTVDGAMTVDVSTLAANIDGVTFDNVANCGGIDQECFWSVPPGGSAVRTGTIRGSYLTGGTLAVDEANDLDITDVKAIAEGSSDRLMKFSMKLTGTVKSGEKLTFKVTKAKQGSDEPLESQPWVVPVAYAFGVPQVTGVSLDPNGHTLTIEGGGFTTDAVAVNLQPPGADPIENVKLTQSRTTTRRVVLDIPSDNRAPGCWKVQVSVNGRPAPAQPFLVPATPKLTSAKADGDNIKVVGTGLVDTEACGGSALSFRLVDKLTGAGKKTLAVEFDPEDLTATGGTLKLPADAKEGTWFLQVLSGTKAVSNVKLE